jgi:hypothetical protein
MPEKNAFASAASPSSTAATAFRHRPHRARLRIGKKWCCVSPRARSTWRTVRQVEPSSENCSS